MSRVNVIGVGMNKFAKPGASEDYPEMARVAITMAMEDAGISYREIQHAYTGYVYGDSCCGHRVMYEVGLTGIPIFNVNSNCSTGSSALYLARQAVGNGAVDCALVVGFELMEPGAIGAAFPNRTSPMAPHFEATAKLAKITDAPPAAQQFGGAGVEHMDKYGTSAEAFGLISVKARRHAANNPYALFTSPLTLDDVMNAAHQYGPLTRLMCCPPTCGAAAAVICSEEFAKKQGITNPVYIAGQALTTDTEDSYTSRMGLVGYGMTKAAANSVYEQTGIGVEDVDVVELHDCFTSNELITYEGLGLCEEGGAEKFIRDGDNTYGGKYVVNPSGGLMSKGHPLGATGLAQCTELVWQLRGTSEKRQVEGARIALQHNLGLGGSAVVTMYRKD